MTPEQQKLHDSFLHPKDDDSLLGLFGSIAAWLAGAAIVILGGIAALVQFVKWVWNW
jgi:hypothetical protein